MTAAGRPWLRGRLALLRARYTLAPDERRFVASCAPRPTTARGPVVALQCTEDQFYVTFFGWLAAGIGKRAGAAFEQVVTRSLRPSASRSPGLWLRGLATFNRFTDGRWAALYGAYCDRIAFRAAGLGNPVADVVAALRAWRIGRRLSGAEDVLALTVDGIHVGDLVYDSYLRFKPAGTLRVRDPYLLVIVWQCLRTLRRARRYFRRRRPACYLSSYSTYIQHGIPVRVALAEGVRVFTLGNFQEVAKELTADDVAHTRNPDAYRAGFAQLPNPAECLEAADRVLSARLAGARDSATGYMRQSAYGVGAALEFDVRDAVVVFLHDFFDSPHVYRWMLFPDFWSWATYTLRVLDEAGIRTLVKPHPNQDAPSRELVDRLRTQFPRATFIDSGVSNRDLAAGGISRAATVYGTVSHELAYLGVPSVAAGHNPHIAFGFCSTARTLEEYGELLRRGPPIPLGTAELREQALQFVYMHNLAMTSAEREFRDRIVEYRVRLMNLGDRFPAWDDYAATRDAALGLPGYDALVARLCRAIGSPA